MVSEAYIDSLDIPESDKALLKRFRCRDWANIFPEKCVSEKARYEAEIMASRARHYEEYSCGID